MDTPHHHLGIGVHCLAICLQADDSRRGVCAGLLKNTEGCEWTLGEFAHGITANPVRCTAARERQPVREQTTELMLGEAELVRGYRELK